MFYKLEVNNYKQYKLNHLHFGVDTVFAIYDTHAIANGQHICQ